MATSGLQTTIKEGRERETAKWYVLYGRYASLSVIDELQRVKDAGGDVRIEEFFVPVEVKKISKGGSTVVKKSLYTGHYIFIKALKDDIVRLKHTPSFTTDIRFLHPRMGDASLITVPEREMQSFRNAVLAMNNEVEYFRPTSEELEAGDRVRIIGGLFDGVEGILEHKRGHDNRRITVAVSSMLAIRTLDIEPENIQVLEFAKAPSPIVARNMQIGTDKKASYTSRAYKEIKSLLQLSKEHLERYRDQGILSEEEYLSAQILFRRYSALQLTGKLREQHAEAMLNLKKALERK